MTDFSPPEVDEPTPAEDAYAKATTALSSGLLDDMLPGIFAAVMARADVRGKGQHWRCTWDGYTLDDIDITMDEAGELERQLGLPWTLIDPAKGSRAALAVVTLILCRQGATWGDAKLEALKASAGKVADSLTYYLGEPPPFACTLRDATYCVSRWNEWSPAEVRRCTVGEIAKVIADTRFDEEGRMMRSGLPKLVRKGV